MNRESLWGLLNVSGMLLPVKRIVGSHDVSQRDWNSDNHLTTIGRTDISGNIRIGYTPNPLMRAGMISFQAVRGDYVIQGGMFLSANFQ